MRFKPKTKEELAMERGTLKAGVCDFEVADAQDQISSKGNEMIKLTLKVWDSDGNEGTVFDYLVSTAQWKILSFLEAVGNPETYNQGLIDVNALVGAAGKARLVIEKDKTGQYGDQAKIKDYLKQGEAGLPKEKKDPILDGEDIPF